jgi:penicillin-binding protein 2
MTDAKLGRRLVTVAAVISFAFAALVTRLWFLQVLAAEDYRDRATGNYVRLIPVPAPRGRILDRNGRALVDNRRAIVITVDRQKVSDEEALLRDLSALLDEPMSDLEERLGDPDYLPYQPVPVYEGASEMVAIYLKEHADDFPGVDVREASARSYAEGGLAPHVLGYLGQVSPEELKDPSFAELRPGQLVGRGGVEQQYEEYLRGTDGWLKQEVDAQGELQGTLGEGDGTPGNDVVLSLDGDIQKLAEETMEEAVSQARGIATFTGYLKATGGAIVVLDPTDGHLLALASYPAFDPKLFLEPLSSREYRRRFLLPDRNYPLTNRAIAGL